MRKKFISKLLVLAMSVSLFSGVPQPVLAEGPADGNAIISGTLLDAKGSPLASKTVTLRERSASEGSGRYTVTTDAKGKYSKEVPAGVYQVIGFPYAADLKEAQPKNVRAVAQVVTADSGTEVKQDIQVPVPIIVPNGEFDHGGTFGDGNWITGEGSTGVAQKVENGKQYSGTNRFRIWLGSNFSFNVYQTLSDLEPGTYAISFVMQTGALGANDVFYAYVKDEQGKILTQENLTKVVSNSWEAVGMIVEVGDSPITVGFTGQMTKDAWGNVEEFRMGRIPDAVETFTKAQLGELLEEAATYLAKDYTTASFANLTTAKESAQEVYDDANAEAREITTAYNALQKAIEDLRRLRQEGDASIQNDTFWVDAAGNNIYSQGGGIFKFQDTYYWYGVKYEEAEQYAANPTKKPYSTSPSPKFLGITCYSSKDLVNWKYEKDVVSREEVSGKSEMKDQEVAWVGRLGVAEVNGKYALFVQHECADADNSLDGNIDSDNFSKQVLVLTSDTPTGDFKWHQRINMKDYADGTPNSGDQTVFTDDDGTSYLVYSKGTGRGKIFLSKIVEQDGKIGLDKAQTYMIYSGAGREGNCMFKYKGKYYVCASDLYGWNASHAYYKVLDNLTDSYLKSVSATEEMKLMAGSSEDFCHVSQTGFFYTVKAGEQETVIFCGDRWTDFAANGLGYNQWCPLSFKEDGTPYFNSLSAWDLDVESATWSVHKTNNYVKNASFDADRVAQKELAGWKNTVNKGSAPINNNGDTVVTGKYVLKLGDSVDFDCKVSQKIEQNAEAGDAVQLPNGTYNLKAKVQNSGTFEELSMYVTSGGMTKKVMIKDRHADYTEITLPDVVVSGNKAEVGFIAKGAKNASALIDDVSFVRADADASTGAISCKITSDTTKTVAITATAADGSIVYVYETELTSGEKTYTLENIAAGAYKVDVAVNSSTVTGAGQNVTVEAGGTAEAPVVTVANQGGSITGKIVDDDNKSLEGVVVKLMKEEEEIASAETAADGTYTISDVLAGEYTLLLEKDGYGAPDAQTVTVTIGQTANVPQLSMKKQIGTISGKVYDQSGAPVSGAKVVARGNRDKNDSRRFTATTSDDGSYTMQVATGSYQVRTEQSNVNVQAVAETITVEPKKSYTADLRLPKQVDVPNGDFESGFSSSNWTLTGTGAKQTDRVQDILNGKGGFNIWTKNDFEFELSQKLKNVRNGRYIINLKSEAGDMRDEDVLYIYAKNSKGEIIGREDYSNVTVKGGEVLGLVVDVTDRALTVGIAGTMKGDCGWSHTDDFVVGRIVPLDADSVAAESVMDKIDEIGTVRLNDASKKKITDAQAAYDGLSEEQRALVDNYDVLTAADKRYKDLVKQKEDQEEADKVIALINSIGTVDASSEAKIKEAKEAYDKLSDEQKKLVKNFNVLDEAQTKYEEIVAEANAKFDISKATVAAIPAQYYNGKNLTPAVTVTYAGKTLVKDTDYTLSYSNNKNIGTAKVTITGKGKYEKSVIKNFTITVKKNAAYTVGSYKYKITNAKTDGKGTVAVVGGKSKSLKKANIGATVKIGGKSFKITSIAKNAFKGYKKLANVTVGKNVTKIENSAFEKCAKLKTIKISATGLKSVGKNAIKGINKKATIKCPKKQLSKYKKLFKSSTGYKKTMKIKK